MEVVLVEPEILSFFRHLQPNFNSDQYSRKTGAHGSLVSAVDYLSRSVAGIAPWSSPKYAVSNLRDALTKFVGYDNDFNQLVPDYTAIDTIPLEIFINRIILPWKFLIIQIRPQSIAERHLLIISSCLLQYFYDIYHARSYLPIPGLLIQEANKVQSLLND